MLTFIKKTEINFIGRRKPFFILSCVMTALGLLALIQVSRGSANLGIDFAGGAAVQLKFDQPIQINTARRALEGGGLRDAELQEVVAENKLIIRLKQRNITKKNTRGEIKDIFATAFPGNQFIVESSTEIGPTIGKKLQRDAINAVLFSLVLIISYIAFRFEFRFGIAAAIATFHDIFVVLGLFFVMNKEITLLVVTALLTIAGYSLNDTVVIFDRIRENLKRRKKESYEFCINRSINDNLSRTLITSLTTLLAVMSLYLFGGEVIHDFALAILLGIGVGTYSSWFIASSLLVTWHYRTGKTGKSKAGKILKKA
ncbi:MAG: protein translocase subunit SecF [Nitrospiria bacterium]